MGLTFALMQPYFRPYSRYFQLIHVLFTILLKRESDYLHTRQRELSPDMRPDKILNKIREAYQQASYFGPPFVPSLSILDVLTFNARDVVRQMLGEYTLIHETIA
jgi:hypothetical protein